MPLNALGGPAAWWRRQGCRAQSFPTGHRATPGLLRAVKGSSRRCQPHGLLSQLPFPRVWEGDTKTRSVDRGSKPLFPAVAALACPVPPSPEPSLREPRGLIFAITLIITSALLAPAGAHHGCSRLRFPIPAAAYSAHTELGTVSSSESSKSQVSYSAK